MAFSQRRSSSDEASDCECRQFQVVIILNLFSLQLGVLAIFVAVDAYRVVVYRTQVYDQDAQSEVYRLIFLDDDQMSESEAVANEEWSVPRPQLQRISSDNSPASTLASASAPFPPARADFFGLFGSPPLITTTPMPPPPNNDLFGWFGSNNNKPPVPAPSPSPPPTDLFGIFRPASPSPVPVPAPTPPQTDLFAIFRPPTPRPQVIAPPPPQNNFFGLFGPPASNPNPQPPLFGLFGANNQPPPPPPPQTPLFFIPNPQPSNQSPVGNFFGNVVGGAVSGAINGAFNTFG